MLKKKNKMINFKNMEANFSKLENKILTFWKKNQIFEKSLQKGKKDFVFYEGPPTANAPPGLHHVLARVYKDIVCRFKTMQNFRVLRKAGWDTHGLPVEIQIEKKLGFSNKKEIEKFGIEKFNKECKKSVWEYKKCWEKLTEKIGFWLDLKNPYITYQPEYIESLWFILKKIWEKKLLKKDFKVLPYCPRCGTSLSSHEVAQGYKKIKEKAIYVKFKIKDQKFENTFLLIWTTTPWTLPANVAVAVNPALFYLKVKIGNEFLILAKESFEKLKLEGEKIEEFKGKDLVGLKYEPPFNFYQPNFEKERIWEVLSADFVLAEEGTALVHIAPAFGEEDMELIKKENEKSEKKFPLILNVNEEGKFKSEVKNWAGYFVKEADPLIIENLKERNLLFKEEIFEHDYPFCWRCNSPLLYYAKKSWFIKMTSLKEKLIENNKKINWFPSYLKEGRFGEWLREIKDWALSRERYWGTPLPIWECKNCGYSEVIGSREDLRKQKFSKNRYLILRHGESIMNKKGILISTLPEKINCPLTKKGREQIKKVAKILKKEKIDLIISSDLKRTKETAEILRKELKIKVIFDKRLREIKAGIFEGKSLKEYQNFWKSYEEKFKKRPKGGENYQDVKMRLYNFLLSLEKKYQGKTILLIGHQRPFAMLEGAVKGYLPKEFKREIEPKKLKNGEFREIELKIFPYNEKGELDFHLPYVDEIKFFCPKCQNIMERVKEVIDCWFDSGAMPFAQYHWPFEGPLSLFPADFISEGIDQTRGWFYTLLAVSTLLGFGPPYKNVLSLGHVLDEKGEKMSKSKGNVVDPFEMIEKYGADTLRWYFFVVNQPWDSKLFSEKDLFETKKKFIFTLWNCFSFFETYKSKSSFSLKISKKNLKNILDRWLISKLNSLIEKVTQELENYNITGAARLIENFVISDLSLWYIRRSRRRFQIPENKKDLKEASRILGYSLFCLSKILAPFLPYLAEYIYQRVSNLNFKFPKSVHLENWPKPEKKLKDKVLEEKMTKIREIVKMALAERQKAKIKVRQPLRKLQLPYFEFQKEKDLLELIKDEVNVKEISFGKNFELDLTLTPELKEEGIEREFIREIQQARKELKLTPKDKIILWVEGCEFLKTILEKKKEEIQKIIKAKKILFQKTKEKIFQKEIEIENEKLIIKISKI